MTSSAIFPEARILIVDDERSNVRLLERILETRGYTNFFSFTSPGRVLESISVDTLDLILLDLHMPQPDGFEVLEEIRRRSRGGYLPILVLTADATAAAKERALSLGANDFVTKPFDATEVALRIHNLLETRSLHLRVRREAEVLEKRVLQRSLELAESQFEMLRRLAQAAEFRDDDTGMHTRRVGETSARVAEKLGLSESDVALIRSTAPLHDVGKIGIPDAILLKPAKLEPAEFELMKTHTTIGAKLLAGTGSDVVSMAETIALHHHERWDGTGYPHGLEGEATPLPARIVAIADFHDALTHDRVYRKAWEEERVLEAVREAAGSHFDPEVAEAFLQVVGSNGGNGDGRDNGSGSNADVGPH